MLREPIFEPGGGTLLLEREQLADDNEVWSEGVAEWVRESTEASPLVRENYTLGRMNRLWSKLESENETGSFKERGAYAYMRYLRESGALGHTVVAASAGNHAQGVVRAARLLSNFEDDKTIQTEVHLPHDTPAAKLDGIERQAVGGSLKVISSYDTFEAAREAVALRSAEPGITHIPPFDNRYIMAGQGTVGLEILEQAEALGVSIDKVFVPVGGGGLLAGVAEAIKRRDSNVQIIGVQMAGNDSAARSFHAGEMLSSSSTNALCEGTAVNQVGEQCFAKIQTYADDIIVISPAELGEAYFHELNRLQELAVHYGDDVYEQLREPAGMLAEAGAAVYAREHDECARENWVSVASGGNYDLSRIDALLEVRNLALQDVAASRIGHTAILNGATQRAYTPSPYRAVS